MHNNTKLNMQSIIIIIMHNNNIEIIFEYAIILYRNHRCKK
jgi:hypothetical protein